jgi:hypothetical protein
VANVEEDRIAFLLHEMFNHISLSKFLSFAVMLNTRIHTALIVIYIYFSLF